MSAPFVAGPDANASRQRHAPLYGRLVPEEHLPATHRDAVHQVKAFKRIHLIRFFLTRISLSGLLKITMLNKMKKKQQRENESR